MTLQRSILLAFMLLTTLSGCGYDEGSSPAPTEASKAGAPKTSTFLARAVSGPADFLGQSVQPRVVQPFDKAIPTNDWWTSLLWPFYPGNSFGENLYAQPLVLKAHPDGLALGYPDEATITPDDVHYTFHFREDLRVGVDSLSAPEIRVEDFSDWTVTPRWESGDTWMKATFGHGLLFSYFRTNADRAKVRVGGEPTVFAQSPGALGLTVNGAHYGLFAPLGSSWSLQGHQASADLAGQDYFAVALLPDSRAETLSEFHSRAFSFVTDTKVSWQVSEGKVLTTYRLSTTTLEGEAKEPPIALYRHQWLRTSQSLEPWSFVSPRGEMKGAFCQEFVTEAPFTGVLPNLPAASDLDLQLLQGFLEEVAAEGPLSDKDTYFGGKDLGKLSNLIPIAEQLGRNDLVNLWLDQIQGRLDDYFDGQAPYRFVYDPIWTTLLAEPVAFESDRYLNDHHFHYGYLIMGAATLARYRPQWASLNRTAVDDMILDVANPERDNRKYPFLRHFDPYAGHSWAAGAQNFAGGNNQESSSEALHFASAVTLWGQETSQSRWVELGAYLYTTEADAVWEYWFDKDEEVLPEGFRHPVLGILWSAGGAYATWWTPNPEEIHGINFLPIHGGSLYLGRYPQALARNLAHLKTEAGELLEWRDIIWSAEAFVEPQQVLGQFLAQRPVPEGGESRAHSYHWLSALAEFGRPRHDVSADIPTFAVLQKEQSNFYIAYNSENAPREVLFSDGFRLNVGAKTMAVKSGPASGSPPSDPEPPVVTPGSALPQTLPSSLSVRSAGGGQWVGTPHLGQILRFENVTADYTASPLEFQFPVDSGNGVGAAVQVEFRFDFEGDGTVDYRETYHYFPTNDVPGFETYSQERGVLSRNGTLQNLSSGTVEIEFWSPIGQADSQIGSEGSLIKWPFSSSSSNPQPGDPDPGDPPPPTSEGSSLPIPPSTLASGDGHNHDGAPYQAKRWRLENLTGVLSAERFQFSLPVDSGSSVANAVQARLRFDFEGDGTFDHSITFGYYPTDDLPGFETYSSESSSSRREGAPWRAFQGGLAELEVWPALGTAASQIGEGGSLRLRP